MTDKQTYERNCIARDAMRYLIEAKVYDFDTYPMDPMRLAWTAYEIADAMMIASKDEPRTLMDYKNAVNRMAP